MAYPDNMYYAGMPSSGGGVGNNQMYPRANATMQDGISYSPVRAPQPQPRPMYIKGRMVQTENDILPGEVPMDGDYATFISSDLKQIFMKTWGKDGKIHTEVFNNVTDQINAASQFPQMDALSAIMARLDDIEKCLKRPPHRPKKQYNKPTDQNGKEE